MKGMKTSPIASGALALPGQITDVSLSLKRGLSAKEYGRVFSLLGRIGRGHPWWIGDALLACEKDHGETYAQHAEIMGLEARTLVNVAHICERIEPARRRAELSFGHHQVVAALESLSDQDRWLEKAATKHWTRAEFRREMKTAGVLRTRSISELEKPDTPEQRIRHALEMIHATRQRLELDQRKTPWAPEQVDDLLNELEAVLA